MFTPSSRLSAHVRHWHKYMHAKLPPHRWFVFRGRWGVTGRSAGNVAEVHDEIQRAGPDVVQHHVLGGDFSRWIDTVVKDDQLALAFSAIELAAKEASDPPMRGAIEEWRRGLVRAIEGRYR